MPLIDLPCDPLQATYKKLWLIARQLTNICAPSTIATCRYGSLVRLLCMRFESKHKYFLYHGCKFLPITLHNRRCKNLNDMYTHPCTCRCISKSCRCNYLYTYLSRYVAMLLLRVLLCFCIIQTALKCNEPVWQRSAIV